MKQPAKVIPLFFVSILLSTNCKVRDSEISSALPTENRLGFRSGTAVTTLIERKTAENRTYMFIECWAPLEDSMKSATLKLQKILTQQQTVFAQMENKQWKKHLAGNLDCRPVIKLENLGIESQIFTNHTAKSIMSELKKQVEKSRSGDIDNPLHQNSQAMLSELIKGFGSNHISMAVNQVTGTFIANPNYENVSELDYVEAVHAIRTVIAFSTHSTTK